MRRRGRGALEEGIEQQLDAEVIRRAPEKDRGQFPAQHFFLVILLAGDLEHLQLLDRPRVIVLLHFLPDERVGKIGHRDRRVR